MSAVTLEKIPAGATEFPNGTFTFQNLGKGTHKTVRIRTSKSSGRRWVSVLAGPCNESDYALAGEVVEGGAFEAHGRALPEHSKIAAWCLAALAHKHAGIEVQGLAIEESRQCVRCNRKLTHPSSISANIGPECAKHYA